MKLIASLAPAQAKVEAGDVDKADQKFKRSAFRNLLSVFKFQPSTS